MSVQLSLSEIDALCRKAARGAGYSWGLSEEAGRAARWLAALGFQGPETLATWLSTRHPDAQLQQPRLIDGAWSATSGLCPITAGALLSDRESEILRGENISLRQVQQPLLVLPQLARIAESSGCAVLFVAQETCIHCVAQGIDCPNEFPEELRSASVRCCLTDKDPPSVDNLRMPSAAGRAVDELAFNALQQLAHRTYAPATEASRLAGAGSGLNDND